MLVGAAAVDPLAVVVGRGLTNELRLQVWRPAQGRPVLGSAGVGAADHADLAVAPRLRRRPLDGIVAVAQDTGAVVAEGVEVPLGGKTAAHVLNDDDVAAAGEELR